MRRLGTATATVCGVDHDPSDPILALKRQLADAILALSTRQPVLVAARRLGIDAARMCDLRRGRIERFSVERLIRILATVDRGGKLTVVPTGPQEICWFPKLRSRRQPGRLERSRRDGERIRIGADAPPHATRPAVDGNRRLPSGSRKTAAAVMVTENGGSRQGTVAVAVVDASLARGL